MNSKHFLGLILAGVCAGTVNGLLGAGGGMVLVPLLGMLTSLDEQEIFSSSIAIILPVCVISILITAISAAIPWRASLPYLIGSAAGGLASGLWGQKIPAKWLHRTLGIFIIWGGIRYLCQDLFL